MSLCTLCLFGEDSGDLLDHCACYCLARSINTHNNLIYVQYE